MNYNSLFVEVSNYRTPYSMPLIINSFNEFLKVIRGVGVGGGREVSCFVT